MHLNYASNYRVSRSVAAVIAAAALTGLGGCSSSEAPHESISRGNTNSSAVSAPGATRANEDKAQLASARSFPTGDRSSSIVMVEAMGPRTVRLQHEASYQLRVTNLTDMQLRNVVVSSTTPDGFEPTSVSGSTTKPAEGGHMGYTVGDLAPKEAKMVTITGMATKVGMVDTCYTIRYDQPTLCTVLQVTNPAISLAVSAPATTDICKPILYQYTVTNTGTGSAHNVTLQEDLPSGLMTTDGKQSVMATLGDIPEGEKRTVTANLKASKTGSLAGQATAKADGDAAPPVATATAVHAPVLTVAVTGGDSDYVGKTVDYTIVVTNKGDATASNARLQVGHSGVLGNVTAEGVDNNGMVALGDLAPNASKTVKATASSNLGGTVTVIANASSDCAATVNASAGTMFHTIPALLLETVDEVDPVKVGQNVTYDIKVTNQGSGPDSNVNVTATIPDSEKYVSTDGPTQPKLDGNTLTFPSIPTLSTKESVTWKVTVKATKANDVQFKTTATSDGVKLGAEKTEPTKLY